IALGYRPDTDDDLIRTLASGAYPPADRPLQQLLHHLTPAGGRVLDLGAHFGVFSLAAAAAGYCVAAVEASPLNAAVLRASAARNGFDRLTVLHACVADRPGTANFLGYGPFGHIIAADDPRHGVIVRAATVDGLLDELGWDRVDFVKMDVEGS